MTSFWQATLRISETLCFVVLGFRFRVQGSGQQSWTRLSGLWAKLEGGGGGGGGRVFSNHGFKVPQSVVKTSSPSGCLFLLIVIPKGPST